MKTKENPKYIVSAYARDTIRKIGNAIYDSPCCKYSSEDIATSIFAACLNGMSIEAMSKSPIGDTVFWRIKKETNLAGIRDLIGLQMPPKGSHLTILIDGHDSMYYGRKTNGVVGTKSKNGSHRAFKYLAAYTTSNPHSIVDVMPLFDGSTSEPALSMIYGLSRDYTIDTVIMDGEFYNAELIDWLSSHKIPFICRRTNTGNIRELGVSYNEPFLYETVVKRGNGTTINLRYWLYRYKGKDGDYYLASSVKTTPNALKKMYKTRWNIETGFREINVVKAKTASPDIFVRLFLYVVSCLIYNLWMKVRFRFPLFVIRMYDFVDHILGFLKGILLHSADIGNNLRGRVVILRL